MTNRTRRSLSKWVEAKRTSHRRGRARIPGARPRGGLRLRAQEVHAQDGARGRRLRPREHLRGHHGPARRENRPRSAPVPPRHDREARHGRAPAQGLLPRPRAVPGQLAHVSGGVSVQQPADSAGNGAGCEKPPAAGYAHEQAGCESVHRQLHRVPHGHGARGAPGLRRVPADSARAAADPAHGLQALVHAW
ncbi:hypothetical protein ON010_g6452 [Phytophthora cinnamomi]|nr:hypothetical protein ON010_g6452 [Phytophthora cinnamomi]